MNWENYWNSVVSKDQGVFEQVQRTASGVPLTTVQMDRYIQYLKQVLDLQESESYHLQLLDLCCGNGWITNKLSAHYQQCLGLDFSKELIRYAKEHFGSNKVAFENTEISNLSLYTKENYYDHIIWLFSLQYFSTSDFESILPKLKNVLNEGGVILLGDIPLKNKQATMYSGIKSKFKYYLKYWLNRESTGKFWSPLELDGIVNRNGMKGQYLKQPASLPYAHYRFDYLITKK